MPTSALYVLVFVLPAVVFAVAAWVKRWTVPSWAFVDWCVGVSWEGVGSCGKLGKRNAGERAWGTGMGNGRGEGARGTGVGNGHKERGRVIWTGQYGMGQEDCPTVLRAGLGWKRELSKELAGEGHGVCRGVMLYSGMPWVLVLPLQAPRRALHSRRLRICEWFASERSSPLIVCIPHALMPHTLMPHNPIPHARARARCQSELDRAGQPSPILAHRPLHFCPPCRLPPSVCYATVPGCAFTS